VSASPGTGATGHVLWAPGRPWWWIALLFTVGSVCFLVAPLPGFIDLVGPETDAAVFFVGSLFFTSAAALQWWDCLQDDTGRRGGRRRSLWQPRRLAWWSSSLQLAGTLFFNATTFRALSTTIDAPSYDRVVWRPDALGSLCFLLSGALAYADVSGGLRRSWPRTAEGAMAAVNLFGCVAFGLAALGAYVLPASGSEVSVATANAMTSLGALGFLLGSLLLLRVGSRADAAAASPAVAAGPATT
jgi:hypothetical protein